MNSLRRMAGTCLTLAAVLLFPWGRIRAAGTSAAGLLRLNSPADYQVHQRATRKDGTIMVGGSLPGTDARAATLEARLIGACGAARWRRLCTIKADQSEFRSQMKAPAGGWYRLELRVRHGDTVDAEGVVEHVGVGEVFVIAGQSNAANHGEERQQTKNQLVAACENGKWRLANDPQPGASGSGGSFIPPFGDAIVTQFRVPVGIVATGIGATSIREWLPRGARFANPPTLTGNVTQLPGGEWESKGTLFENLVTRMKQPGLKGFRAVLWHQGESDANQQDPSRTLPGELYEIFLEQLIRDSRCEVGWQVPWFVAQVSYHKPDDEGSPDIRAAQQALWQKGIALEGPDSDELRGELREDGGKGIHFSGEGLREHGLIWARKVGRWLENQLGQKGRAAVESK